MNIITTITQQLSILEMTGSIKTIKQVVLQYYLLINIAIYNMKKLLYIIIPIGILAALNMLTDLQYIIVGWIFISIWIIKILTEK